MTPTGSALMGSTTKAIEMDALGFIQSPVLVGLWGVALVGDLRQRRVPLTVSLILIGLSLIGRPWPWWLLTIALVFWPGRRSVVSLAPVAIGVGAVLGDPVTGVTLALAALAWGLNWWGGADSIALTALGLRHGLVGVLGGSLAVMVIGLALMVVRRRSLAGVLSVLPEAVALQPRASEAVPLESEMPAAAALAVAGLVLEVGRLIGG